MESRATEALQRGWHREPSGPPARLLLAMAAIDTPEVIKLLREFGQRVAA
jgi:hypothetical protein